ncbi:MAG: TolC family protein [Winogradskyella sp.]|uniref:TolC family protein n=1 Tax=Winogradskyella sp. TaxID=1883156 RepID=UPI00185D53E0|nr:TolC family protein [Winogradskyella sp.]MBT8244016.1 TolC family protein [Winogradskyella sp.]NNK23315.1 TolC family protein [Winogradskyella sp.]
MKTFYKKILVFISITFIATNTFSQEVIKPSDAIALALEHNYGIQIAKNNVEVAANNKNILNSGYLPTLAGNAGGSIDRQDAEGQLANGDVRVAEGAETRRYNASISLNYTLFDGLGRYYDYKRLKQEYNLTELQARETIENTTIQLLTIYYNIAQESENFKSLKETLKISKDRLTRSEYQFDYGQNTKLDVLNAEVDINNDSISIINARQNLINFKRDLNLVTGNKITNLFEVDTTIIFLMQLDKEELRNKVFENNVTLIQNEKNIAINEFTLKANKSGYLPTIGLTGSYGWNESTNNSPLAFVLQNTSTNVSVGINLTWNLFDGGTTITRVKNARINLENQKLQKEQLRQEVERNFNNTWDDYQNKLRIYEVQEDNIKTAKNNFERTEEKFKLGQVTSIEFRQAQLNLLNAELSRNQAKYQAKLAEVLVLQVSGELLNVEF